MSMEGKIRVPNFKNVLKILKGIGEEAILVFDEDGLSVRMVDGKCLSTDGIEWGS